MIVALIAIGAAVLIVLIGIERLATFFAKGR